MKENQHIEWKESWRDEYLKWICGFANADGGVLDIGRNDKGVVVGLPQAQKLMEDIPNKIRDVLGIMAEVNRTEGGKFDFDRLKLALGESVDVGKERYGMNWPGKANCFKTIQAPSLGTLRPCPEESVNFDTSENDMVGLRICW